MNITIFGSGYVGLVTAVCFADVGNNVLSVDVDAGKVAKLQRGESPIYEPGLTELLQTNMNEGRIRFTTSAALRSIKEQGGSTRGRKEEVDALAACILLEGVLRASSQGVVLVVPAASPHKSMADVLASTAHLLARAGWQRGQAWGAEVVPSPSPRR